MGSGIVEVCARAGLRVTFVEGSDELVVAGRGRVERSIGKAVERGKLDAAAAEEALGRIDAATDLGALADVDLVIEAATEDREAKAAIFARLGELTRPEVVLASNTSSIPIRELGAASGRPDKVIGMHFFNPPPVMALLELTPSKDTGEETYELVRAFGSDVLGKTCVRSGDEAGFIVNRLLIPYLFDAIRLYEAGSRPGRTSIRRCAWGSRIRWGRSHWPTSSGWTHCSRSARSCRRRSPASRGTRHRTLLRDLVAEGKLGKKSGGRLLRVLRRLHALASLRAHGRAVRGAGLDVQPIAGGEFDVALVGVEHDRPGEAEQHLVERVVVPAVAVTGSVPPEPWSGTSLCFEGCHGAGARRVPRPTGRTHA